VQLAAETSHFPLLAAFGTVTWGERTDAKTRVGGINLAAGAGAWVIGLQAWEGTREIPAATTKPWRDVCSFGFTGREHEAGSGLVYARARYLSSVHGQWTQPDPLGLLDGVNRYQYAHDGPTRFSDPTGLKTWGCCYTRCLESLAPGWLYLVYFLSNVLMNIPWTFWYQPVDWLRVRIYTYQAGWALLAPDLWAAMVALSWGAAILSTVIIGWVAGVSYGCMISCALDSDDW
jgi:RHS repeat-associated protein